MEAYILWGGRNRYMKSNSIGYVKNITVASGVFFLLQLYTSDLKLGILPIFKNLQQIFFKDFDVTVNRS